MKNLFLDMEVPLKVKPRHAVMDSINGAAYEVMADGQMQYKIYLNAETCAVTSGPKTD